MAVLGILRSLRERFLRSFDDALKRAGAILRVGVIRHDQLTSAGPAGAGTPHDMDAGLGRAVSQRPRFRPGTHLICQILRKDLFDLCGITRYFAGLVPLPASF
jgi:hypothetical protein